ncbi:TPA: DNA-binding protein, partial [Streptococcus pyogenes]
MTDLTTSQIERQNILNNSLAIKQAEEILKVPGFYFEDSFYFTNSQIASFFDVDIRTIERLVEAHKIELTKNGYHTLRGEQLANFKENAFATDTNVGSKVTQLSISSFRTLLNFAMLLTNSDIAKQVRNTLLDIVINVLTEKTGGHVKFINQRDKNYLSTALEEDNARKIFTNA